MCCLQKTITWSQTEVEYCKMRLWFTSHTTCGFIYKHIIQCTYEISQNNWIGTFYNIIFTDEWTKSNHKTIELWYSTYVNTYFLIVWSQFLLWNFWCTYNIKQSHSTMFWFQMHVQYWTITNWWSYSTVF